MMLHLTGVPGKQGTLGPSSYYRLEGHRLLDPARTALATREGDFWKAGDSLYTTITCPGPVSCHFEGGSHRRDDVEGPFAVLMLVGGALWGDEITIARYAGDSDRWVLLHTGNDFRAIALRPVPAHPGPSRH